MSPLKPFQDSTTAHLPAGDGSLARRRLLVLWEGGMVQRDLPERGAIVLGRGAECDVQIEHSSVSRRHATLHVGQTYTLEDHGSANGTRVDGRPVKSGKSVAVSPGQEIQLGSTTLVLPPAAPIAPSLATGAGPAPTGATLSPAMRELHETLELVAKGKIPVLIVGETGVGKELIARELHGHSPRAARPLSTLACANFPENLLETELFGFERGAFAGALETKPGLVEQAAGGTLLLDEVGALPLTIQAKLLRMLESGEVMRLGSLHPVRVDVRFVATTNRDLEQLVANGTFRSDLYYRLNGAKLVVPALRDRRTEIAPLARLFAAASAAELGVSPPMITAPALVARERHDWPGNIRELKNVIGRAVLLTRGGPIGIEHVGVATSAAPRMPTVPPPDASELPMPNATGDLRSDLGVIERDRILAALAQCDGNQSRAAKLLGMPRRTLLSRLDAHQLPRPRKRSGDDS